MCNSQNRHHYKNTITSDTDHGVTYSKLELTIRLSLDNISLLATFFKLILTNLHQPFSQLL